MDRVPAWGTELEPTLVSSNVECNFIPHWPKFVQWYTNISTKRFPPDDEECVLVNVGRLINNIRVISIKEKLEVFYMKADSVHERHKTVIVRSRSRRPVIHEICQ